MRVWNTTTGDCEAECKDYDHGFESVIALADGRLVSCSSRRTVRVWNATTGYCEKVLKCYDDGVLSILALPNDRFVSCSSLDTAICVWNVNTGHEHVVESVIALPD
eukprot:gene69589-biopygen43433